LIQQSDASTIQKKNILIRVIQNPTPRIPATNCRLQNSADGQSRLHTEPPPHEQTERLPPHWKTTPAYPIGSIAQNGSFGTLRFGKGPSGKLQKSLRESEKRTNGEKFGRACKP
jgi:hypothetical protein